MEGCFNALTLREIGRIRSRLIDREVQVGELREQTTAVERVWIYRLTRLAGLLAFGTRIILFLFP